MSYTQFLWITFCLSLTQYFHHFLHLSLQLEIVCLHLADFFVGVDDSGVVAAAEQLTDARIGQVGQLTAEVHSNLAREGDVLCALFIEEKNGILYL